MSALLAQTERIRVTSAVTVLSTEDPVRVFQQFATMDQFSHGRAELLAGRGSFIESYPLFGADLHDYDALFDEKLALLMLIDRGGSVTWQGRFRAPIQNQLVLPRPADVPGRGQHLNLGIATGGNAQSSVRAGVLGLPINYAIIGGEPARFAPLVGLYREALARGEAAGAPGEAAGAGAGAGDGLGFQRTSGTPQVTVSMMGFVAERGARDFWFPYWYETMRGISAERGFPAPTRQSFDAMAGPGGAYAVGTPEEVAEKLVAVHRALGNDRCMLQMDLTGVPQAESLRAIELLGTRVKPLVDAALATSA